MERRAVRGRACSAGRSTRRSRRTATAWAAIAADTFTATVVVTVHAGRWSTKELARHLKRHRKFFIGGPAGKEGLLLEIVPDTLRKVEAMMSLLSLFTGSWKKNDVAAPASRAAPVPAVPRLAADRP